MIPQPGVLDKRHPAKKRPLGAYDALNEASEACLDKRQAILYSAHCLDKR